MSRLLMFALSTRCHQLFVVFLICSGCFDQFICVQVKLDICLQVGSAGLKKPNKPRRKAH